MADEALEAAATFTPDPRSPGPHKHHRIRELRTRVLGGSATMLLSSLFVGGLNLIYNFAVAHELGAGDFGHASVVYTMLMLLSSVTLSFQLVCSKFVARSESADQRAAIYHLLHRRAWICGAAVGLLLFAADPVITEYLNLPSNVFVRTLALTSVFYIPLGVRRGFFQGTLNFPPLAGNFALEAVVKLVGAVVLLSAGYGVEGVVGAMAASVIVAYFVAIPRKHPGTATAQARLSAGVGEGMQALSFFVGQVIINNLDIILVKHFFDPAQAGVYAAVALVGRVVYMLSWSVVSSMFPLSAGIRSGERGGRTVVSTALLMVIVISSLFTLCVWLAPSDLWRVLLGAGFPVEGHRFYSALLVMYAVTTAIYGLGVVLMTYEISRKIGNVSWVQLGFSGTIIVGIYMFHSTLKEVIVVQLVLMTVLLVVVAIPFARNADSSEGGLTSSLTSLSGTLTKIRRVDENEAIAEFLKGEFYQPEFRRYRKSFADLVNDPDLANQRDNSLRRALLYRRRGRLWRELPADTEWWEIEVSSADILRTRVFPRNQWLRYGAPSFLLTETVERIRTRILSNSRDPFIEKLRSLSIEMAQSQEYNSVILITINEATPLTVIEGNHRMAAAALVSPDTLPTRFRFLCGFSPRMSECCWYQTDVASLWRYARNTVSYYLRDRRKLIDEILQGATSADDQNGSGSDAA